jgi:putative transposase
VYHVLKRAVARLPLFEKAGDHGAFQRVLSVALEEHPMRILAFVLMPTTGLLSFGRKAITT